MVNVSFFLLIILELATITFAFVPHNLVKLIIERTNSFYEKTPFGYVSQTLTHEEIIKRGIIRSVAKFFPAVRSVFIKSNLLFLKSNTFVICLIYIFNKANYLVISFKTF